MATSGVLTGTPAALYAPGGVDAATGTISGAKVIASEVDTPLVQNPTGAIFVVGDTTATLQAETNAIVTAVTGNAVLQSLGGTVFTVSSVVANSDGSVLASATGVNKTVTLQTQSSDIVFKNGSGQDATVVGITTATADNAPQGAVKASLFYTKAGALAAGVSTQITFTAAEAGTWAIFAQSLTIPAETASAFYNVDAAGAATYVSAGALACQYENAIIITNPPGVIDIATITAGYYRATRIA